MAKKQAQLFAAPEIESNETSFQLNQLEVYNWGPFSGLHRAEFDTDGTAIIGPTGSGKTTLVDALTTLLVGQPRYNLASTGGHESDRTLMSYVRGVLGGDGSDGREEVARPGKTVTGICATYKSDEEELKLASLLWTDGSSSSAQDLKRRWLFSQAEGQSLEGWLTLLHDDGTRELKRTGRETGKLRIFETKKPYLAHIRKFFDVGQNAFTLLNRAAGLKQLNSIDEIFRDLVLDDRSAFDRALEVAGEFDNLAGIHAELETARRQQESLVPIADENKKLEKSRLKLGQIEALKRILPVWFAMTGERLWSEYAAAIETQRSEEESGLTGLNKQEQDSEHRVDTLKGQYLELGGNVIEQLEKTIESQRSIVADRRKHADDYRRVASVLGLDGELAEATLHRNQAALRKTKTELEKQRNAKDEEFISSRAEQKNANDRVERIKQEVARVKQRPGSNIPPKLQDFRSELAKQLGLTEKQIPFLAELIEVKPGDSAWRGAIERALGSERLRILVPERDLEVALKWVNHRNNRVHVRLQKAGTNEPDVNFFSDSYARKLNFKQHPLLSSAQRLIGGRDFHCVDSVESLRTTEHALTVEGMISGRRGRFEKQDQRRLQDNWFTGFDNNDQLEALARELTASQKLADQCSAESEKHRKSLQQFDQQLSMIGRVVELEFSTIDLPGAEAELNRSTERLAALLDPGSDASLAKSQYDSERQKLETIRKQITTVRDRVSRLTERLERAEKKRDEATQLKGKGLTEDDVQLAKSKLRIDSEVDADKLHIEERAALQRIEGKLEKQSKRVSEHEQRIVRFMVNAQKVDTGALAETGSELADINDYLERLRVLDDEALPEKLGRFLDYLNRSSDQGVTQLLAGINEEVDAVEQRISDLNRTLLKVDFRSGRYLQLRPQRIKHERIRSLETAIRKLRSATFKGDDGESQYKALRESIEILREAGENRRQVGSRALLDPRYRLAFFVVEVDRQTGDESPRRTGSQSGSGGEKELMASHILTASLSYALCPAEASRPLYATVVLDEAFSKSSPSAATRIIEALRVFRLHPIFVTPNKEIGLLKQHTRKVICVQRPKKQASLASISWEVLEEMAPA